jgi:hypothetical protein
MARAFGFDAESVALIRAWFPRRVPGTLRINRAAVAMELPGEVRVLIRNPNAFDCPDYEPLPGSLRCRSYVAGGGCSRPDHVTCIEWQRANRS